MYNLDFFPIAVLPSVCKTILTLYLIDLYSQIHKMHFYVQLELTKKACTKIWKTQEPGGHVVIKKVEKQTYKSKKNVLLLCRTCLFLQTIFKIRCSCYNVDFNVM